MNKRGGLLFSLLVLLGGLAAGCGDDDTSGTEDSGVKDDSGELPDCSDADTLPETIDQDTIVDPGCIRIEKTTVRDGATLTIQPGTTVLMAAGGHLSISWNSSGGTLRAVGTAAQPILFTSENESPIAGDWECVRIHNNGSASDIQHVTFEYGGAGCTIDGSNPTSELIIEDGVRAVTNSTFRHSAGYGVLIQVDGAVREFANNTFEDNEMASIHVAAEQVLNVGAPNTFVDDDDVIEVTGFALGSDGTWSGQEVPYRVVDPNFEIHDGATVTIEAGTTIELVDNLEAFDANLTVAGTEAAPVIFTASPTAASGSFGCIKFTSGAQTTIDHAIIENAGRGCSAALEVQDDAVIMNTTFRDITGEAIDTQGDCNEDWCTENTFEGLEGDELECGGGNKPTSC